MQMGDNKVVPRDVQYDVGVGRKRFLRFPIWCGVAVGGATKGTRIREWHRVHVATSFLGYNGRTIKKSKHPCSADVVEVASGN